RSPVRDPPVADDLAQEFAVSLVRGEFRHADPERGRFRNYLKAVLFHLVSRHRDRQRRQPRPLAANSPELDALAAPPEEAARQFDDGWRDELLARTWDALEQAQPTLYPGLRGRAAHPGLPSHELAGLLGRQLGRALTGDGLRQSLRP